MPVVNDLRSSLFEHVQRLAFSVPARPHLSDVAARIGGDTRRAEGVLTRTLPVAIYDVLTLVVILIVVLLLEWRLALLALIPLPLILLGFRVLGRRSEQASYENMQQMAKLNRPVAEYITALPLVKTFGLDPLFTTRYQSGLNDWAKTTRRFSLLGGFLGTLTMLGGSLMYALMSGGGAFLLYTRQMGVGEFVASLEYIRMTLATVQRLGTAVPQMQTAAGSLRRIEDVLDEVPALADAPNARPLPPFQHAVRFDDVSFSFDGERLNLDVVNLTLRSGESVALIGPSGSGKSALLSLLARFYDPGGGRITLDGHDLRDVTQASLHEQIALVPREPLLISGTVQENIALWRPDATEEEVQAAAQAVGVHEMILHLPQGYATRVSDRSGFLTRGDRQQIAIARVLLRDAPIVIVDDATSSLDPAVETPLLTTLRDRPSTRLLLVVPSRLTTTVLFDRVLIFDHGQVAEDGVPRDLLARESVFAGVWAEYTTPAVPAVPAPHPA